MMLLEDFIYSYRGYDSDGGKCRIRIYSESEKDLAPTMICSEIPENENTSISDMTPYLVEELRHQHALIMPRWIEHYPPNSRGNAEETFNLVTFGEYDPSKASALGDSDWGSIVESLGGAERRRIKGEPNRIPVDRITVESLIGQSV